MVLFTISYTLEIKIINFYLLILIRIFLILIITYIPCKKMQMLASSRKLNLSSYR